MTEDEKLELEFLKHKESCRKEMDPRFEDLKNAAAENVIAITAIKDRLESGNSAFGEVRGRLEKVEDWQDEGRILVAKIVGGIILAGAVFGTIIALVTGG